MCFRLRKGILGNDIPYRCKMKYLGRISYSGWGDCLVLFYAEFLWTLGEMLFSNFSSPGMFEEGRWWDKSLGSSGWGSLTITGSNHISSLPTKRKDVSKLEIRHLGRICSTVQELCGFGQDLRSSISYSICTKGMITSNSQVSWGLYVIIDCQCMLALGELAHFIPCIIVCFDMCECLMQTGSGKSCSLKAFDELSSMPSTLHILSHLILTATLWGSIIMAPF